MAITDFFRLSRWRAGHLLLGWCVYWLALLLAIFGPAIPSAVRVSQLPDGMANATASFGSDGLSMAIVEAGSPIWHLSIGFLPLMLLISVPPLLLWFVWLRVHKREPLDATTSARV